MMFNRRPKGNCWPNEWFSKTPFVRCFPARKEVSNVVQKTVTCHGISRPMFIQAGLQRYRGCSFFHHAYCPFCFTICLGTTGCGRTTIPLEIFTCFAKFPCIVCIQGVALDWLFFDFRLMFFLKFFGLAGPSSNNFA